MGMRALASLCVVVAAHRMTVFLDSFVMISFFDGQLCMKSLWGLRPFPNALILLIEMEDNDRDYCGDWTTARQHFV
jgi:hypothetical protein